MFDWIEKHPMAPIVAVSAVVVVLGCFLITWLFRRKVDLLLGEVSKVQKDNHEETRTLIEKYLLPRTRTVQDPKHVVHEAALIVQRAINAASSPSKDLKAGQVSASSDDSLNATASSTKLPRNDSTGSVARLVIFGASSLATFGELSEKSGMVENEYTKVLYDNRDCLNIDRYVHLPRGPEIARRRNDFQNDYIQWLQRQSKQLGENRRYHLFDVIRAPEYGANIGRYLADDTILDVTGNGRSAIVITESRIAEAVRSDIEKAVHRQGQTRNQGEEYSISNIGQFEELIFEIEKEIEREQKMRREENKTGKAVPANDGGAPTPGEDSLPDPPLG